MASLSTSAAGPSTIQFIDADGKRKSIRLGIVPKKTAEAIKLRVEALLNAKITNTPWDRDTAAWLAGIGADLAGKLARQYFQVAVRARILSENPRLGIKGPGQTNPERLRFVDRAAISRLTDVADSQWRLILALARYGGVRVPSELEPLMRAEIDFERGRLRVTAPKTAHHDGGGERWIPLFPELLPHVEQAFCPSESFRVLSCPSVHMGAEAHEPPASWV
jgi:integrase